MGAFGGGTMSIMGGTKEVVLSDSDGSDTFEIKDSDGFTIFKIDSQGNLKIRGEVGRI